MLAYRGEDVLISTDTFVCPECGTALEDAARPKGPAKILTALTIGVLALIVAVLGAGMILQASRLRRTSDAPPPTEAAPEPTATPPQIPKPVVRAEPIAPAASPETPATPATPPPSYDALPVVRAEAVAPPSAVAAPDLNLASQETRDVRLEVLKRIDLMPTITEEYKDKLYVSVERARQMGRIVSIPFGSGKTSLGPTEIATLRQLMSGPAIQALKDDPTTVFVILGYADTKGDEKKNQAISEARASAVLNALRDHCGVANVMHSVGMGGSTLFDPSGAEKNRVAEIWAVLP